VKKFLARLLGLLCATFVLSMSSWFVVARNLSTTETQRTQRLHIEERQRDFEASKDLLLSRDTEVGLEIEARSPGASWARTGAEASAITIEVDGEYSQDLLLWAGDCPFIYRVMLGRLAAGKHQISLRDNPLRSARGAQGASILTLRVLPLEKNSHHTCDDLLALANSPVLYQRPNTIDRFSDLPLLMYYEIKHLSPEEILVRYTTIFSNEDGGTQTAALMARWGRAADIEWVYEFRARSGQIIEENFQSVSHETKPFKGKHINGNHPVLSVVSDNNNFSDEARSSVRFALLPVAADLNHATRESVLDANPTIYRVIAEELAREGKLNSDSTDPNSISDPRNYVYVDLHAIQNDTAISVEISASSASPKSDLGDPKLRIDRSGYFRTAVRLASPYGAASISAITVTCHSNGPSCKTVEVQSVAVLDRAYKPRLLQIERISPRTLWANEKLTIAVRK
jgi:hypothetical protein